MVTLAMARDLSSKGINVTPGMKFCLNCLIKYNKLYTKQQIDVTQETILSESTEKSSEVEYLASPAARVNTSLTSLSVSPINLHSVPSTSRASTAKRKYDDFVGKFTSEFSQAYGIEEDELVTSEDKEILGKYDDPRSKSDELDRLHELMKDKLKGSSFSEKIQILTLIPDSWSRSYCSTFFDVSEHLIRQARDLKKTKGILAVPNAKKGKKLPDKVIEAVINFYEDDEFSRLLPGKKDTVSIGYKEHQQKRLLLCNLKELFAAFKKKHKDLGIKFSKFCVLRPKWCILAGSSGTHSVCVCSYHQNAILLMEAMDWNLTYKDLIKKIVCDETNRTCMLHRCEKCPGIAALSLFLDKEFENFAPDEEIHFYQWQSTDRTSLLDHTATVSDYKDLLLNSIDSLTKHSFIAKSQASYLKEKKVNLGVNEAIVLLDFAENYQFFVQDEIQSHHWTKEYCTIHPVVIYHRGDNGVLLHESLCFVSDDNVHDVSFVHQVLRMTMHEIAEKWPEVDKILYFSDGCSAQYKNFKNFINLCYHHEDFGLRAEWAFFATSHGKSPCDGIGGLVKRTVANRALQRPLNPILTVKQFIEVCRADLPTISVFEIDESVMNEVRDCMNERWQFGKSVPGTRNSHHFIPLTRTRIGHRFTSEGTELFTHDFNNADKVIDLPQISAFIACIYDSRWWIGQVLDIDEEEGDVRVQFMWPHGPRKQFSWPHRDDICDVPFTNILCTIAKPQSGTASRRTLQISDYDFNRIVIAFEQMPE